MEVKPERTLAVTILAILAGIAGVLSLLDAARYMGWLPIAQLGDMNFFLPEASWFAAIMAAIVGLIFFLVAYWIWNLNPSGWLFVVVITVINLIFLFLAILGKTTFSAVLPAVLINALALILAILPSTKEAFQMGAVSMAVEEVSKVAESVDLTKIEGVGPQIQNALNAAGIKSYEQLANTSPDRLSQITSDAGAIADPETWPAQARMAADGRWAELEEYQKNLKGGRTE